MGGSPEITTAAVRGASRGHRAIRCACGVAMPVPLVRLAPGC